MTHALLSTESTAQDKDDEEGREGSHASKGKGWSFNKGYMTHNEGYNDGFGTVEEELYGGSELISLEDEPVCSASSHE